MIEKENGDCMSRHYQQWSQKQLNQRILALYDQIEHVTVQNLQVAQRNSELEIQIRTIDEIILSHSNNQSINTPSTHETQNQIVEQYGNLLKEHKQLAHRVSQIEEFLFSGSVKNSFLVKDNATTLNRVTSIQDIMRHSRKKTVGKGKIERGGVGIGLTSRRQETARKTKYN